MDGEEVQGHHAGQSEPNEGPVPCAPVDAPDLDVAPLTVGQCLVTLVAGLLPFIGVVCCLVWAYGRTGQQQRRNLGKALLWLHGFVMVAAIVALCVWVVVLAARYGLFTSSAL